jgi:4-amino-4-deoxy-L-arabinose transferase-like glycosyltransferase
MSETKPAPASLRTSLKRAKLRSWLVRNAYPLLAVLCLLLWLPGILSLPALDRDESRFAQSSRQMLDSGNFVDIRFGTVPRYKKPVGIYWAQAATTALAGHIQNIEGDHSHIWTYRLPSLLGGIAAVWLIFWAGSAFGGEVGLVAALLMGFSVLMTAEATIATTDAVLLAAILGAQGVLMRIYRAAREGSAVSTRMVMWGWASFAIAILVKGPVGAGVTGSTIVGLLIWDWWDNRPRKPVAAEAEGDAVPSLALPESSPPRENIFLWLKSTRPLLGLPLVLLIVAPWLIAIGLQSHGAFFQQSLGNDFAAKLAGGQEGHGAPPGYNLLLSAVAFWPGILFVLPGIGLGIARAREPAVRFLLVWAASWWLICEGVPTKLPQYVMPAYPALAILAALLLFSPRDEAVPLWRRVLPYIASVQFLIGLGGLVAAPILLPRLYGAGDAPSMLVYVIVAGLIGLGALIMAFRDARLIALALAFAALAIFVPTLTLGVGPHLTQFWVSEKLAALVAKDTMPGDPSPALAGFEEPSLVFALDANVTLTDGIGAAKQGADQGGLALVNDHERSAFLAHLAELQSDAVPLDEVSGFNYSRGKPVHVTIYRARRLASDVPSPHVTTQAH